MADPASDSVNGAQGHAANRYSTGFSDREPYLVRARRIAKLTIPSMFREWGATGMSDDVTPWQSLGGYCVNNFAAKVVLAAWPPGIPNVNLKPSKKTMADFVKLPPDQRGDLKAALDKALSLEEQSYVEAMEEDGDRAVLFDALRHMVIGGNHGLHVTAKGPLVGYPLEQFVVWRDRAGNLTEFCIEDPMSYESLDADIQDLVRKQGYGPTEGDVNSKDYGKVSWTARNPLYAPINVYTYGVRRRGTWTVCTDVMGIEVPGSSHPYTDETLPYLFPRMVALKKEAYGRSYCEDYEGDLQTYDAIWQALTEGGAALARMITLIKAGGTTNKDDYAKAANGAVITGDKEEVAVVRADKGGRPLCRGPGGRQDRVPAGAHLHPQLSGRTSRRTGDGHRDQLQGQGTGHHLGGRLFQPCGLHPAAPSHCQDRCVPAHRPDDEAAKGLHHGPYHHWGRRSRTDAEGSVP